ncbi:hypothetical protein V7148_06495 [Gottfriedia acidiceleris]|uniref:hypothetical protein n=1 Tax=Bacillaceae TaxID=186817 RepID=UPI0015966F01|nr:MULTISPECIES: hypothetical protein [unclassified Bacillus (in: firmicutes)]
MICNWLDVSHIGSDADSVCIAFKHHPHVWTVIGNTNRCWWVYQQLFPKNGLS